VCPARSLTSVSLGVSVLLRAGRMSCVACDGPEPGVLAAVFDYLQDLGLANWVRSSPSLFAYPAVLTGHALGLAIVVGINTLIALRLLGVAQAIPLAALRRLYAWCG